VITIAHPHSGIEVEKVEVSRMACPFFMPMEKLEDGTWQHAARLPLGCGWSGHCTVPGHEDERLQTEELRGCNMGYADLCQRRPQERAWDAVRFAVRATALRAEPAGSEALGGRIELQYVCERKHRPAEHGALEFDSVGLKWLRVHGDPRVQKMAECFLQAHLDRRKTTAGGASAVA
jgi:hypothetical protein